MNPDHLFQYALDSNEATVHQFFVSAADRYPDHTAVIFGDSSITYSALNTAADELSKAVCGTCLQEPIIGVEASRSIETIIFILAILKAGKAYLPLDPTFPAQRLQKLINDSGLKTCVAGRNSHSVLKDLGLHAIDNSPSYEGPWEKDTAKLAYVLYTSGSTGQPKGVCMGHAALSNLLAWQAKNSTIGEGDRTLQFAPLTFDVSFQEIFATLTTGGTLVLIEDELRIEPLELLHFIRRQNIKRLFLPFVALQYLTETASAGNHFPENLREIITAGEQLKITPGVARFFKELPNCSLTNQYGPTEAHVVTSHTLTGDPDKWPKLPSIGTAITNTEILIVNEEHEELAAGAAGELCIAGVCLADQYLNQPALTAARFVEVKSASGKKVKAYLSGDLAKILPDGNIEYLGRKDSQVKIRGIRIEPGEIEVIINANPIILQAVVTAKEDRHGQNRLIAYLVSANGDKDSPAIRAFLADRLPDYMMPSSFVWLDEFPKTTSGKIDRNNLPVLGSERPELAVMYQAPKTDTEKNIVLTWQDIFGIDKLGIHDNFFELGGNSLLALRTVAALQSQFNQSLPVTKVYQYPTAAGLAKILEGKTSTSEFLPVKQGQNSDDSAIAIVGMSLRFPGANTPEEFWEVLTQGKETITFFTKEELSPFVNEEAKNADEYVRARGIINDIQYFDASFFGINPKAAELMDPQQRVFLEIAWEVLEKTGHLPGKYNGSIGVYAGCGNNTYYLNNVLPNPSEVDKIGQFNVMTLNEKDYIASRTAYELDLRGPAVSVFSACSTSLLAVTQAVAAIRKGQCTIAIAGGASVTAPVNGGHLYAEGGVLSKDGHCRPFDAAASGTVFSDGAGVVLLKSLAQAEIDGDTVYAVVRGTGINNDGAGKGSFMAPNAEGQARAIQMAINDAGIKACDISYIETHGTATPIGDPIEIEGLQLAFSQQAEKQFCAIGSVKSNIGHLTAASGVAGLIKTVLSLHHQVLPASLFLDKPNPQIDFTNSPFYVNTALKPWLCDKKRIAGISSFGVGGTNVHLIVEEYHNKQKTSGSCRSLQLVAWSAKSENSGLAYKAKLQTLLRSGTQDSLADVAFSLRTSSIDFNYRYFTIAGNTDDALVNFSSEEITAVEENIVAEQPSEIVFMFPGQGSQYADMGRDLYNNETAYKDAVDECATLLQPYLGADIREIIFSGDAGENSNKIYETLYAQAAIFTTEYALSKLWINWGISPTVLCGHSIGELVAAQLAGIFSLDHVLNLIVARSQLISKLPPGKMLSIRTGVEKINALLPATLSIAAINGDKLVVVAGPEAEIVRFAELLTRLEITSQVLMTSHAFHSSMLDPIVGEFRKVVDELVLLRPQKPIMSTVTGTWLTDAQAIDPQYWCDHLRNTVLFADAIENILKLNNPLLLEVGPGNVTASMARQLLKGKKISIIATFENRRLYSEYHLLLKALGRLWLQGLAPDWQAFYAGQQRMRVEVPTYAFIKKKCWIDPPISQQVTPPQKANIKQAEAQAGELTNANINSKFMRKDLLTQKIIGIIEDASGIAIDTNDGDTSFLELGLDSLLLTQLSLTLKKEFKQPVSFRQLQEDSNTVNSLAAYFDIHLPSTVFNSAEAKVAAPIVAATFDTSEIQDDSLDAITKQLQALALQVAAMQGNQPAATISNNGVEKSPNGSVQHTALTAEELTEIKKPFGAQPRIERKTATFSHQQATFLEQLTKSYNFKTKGSKAYSQEHRPHMADPRVVTGFSPLTKELVYSLVVNRSKGSRIWDIDNNEYIDVLNGFGSNIFGYQPDFLKKAIYDQMEKGYELGPQHELAGEVSKMICEFTGLDRAGFCNTGSEAVLGAVRVARTVTGRSLIVAFTGSYHGIFDEVIIRGTKKLKSLPAAPGIMPEAVQNMLILDYGTEETLQIIKERASEIAAVLVEPVQSRRPEFQPVAFLKQVRAITEQAGTILIFDEVITGFRMHPGGAQALFGIRADLASYGKVIGGGLPIGVIAGKRQFMDALDGGFWQYGDASFPEVGVTYFAGTFVRHPLALATAHASLLYMKEKGPRLQESINQKTDQLALQLNAEMQKRNLPMYVAHFGSLWKIKFKEEVTCYELMFTLMREKGIHIWDGFPCFMTEAHSATDISAIVAAFAQSVDEMIAAGFYKETAKINGHVVNQSKETPAGAKLGRDKNGNPAWFVADPAQPGKYLQVKV